MLYYFSLMKRNSVFCDDGVGDGQEEVGIIRKQKSRFLVLDLGTE